ncbi:MAG: transposase, partial [Nitrososphaerota archaeon]|nr:transposase [Nitrososphaerota archaeon]
CPVCDSTNLRVKTSNIYVKTLDTYVQLLQCRDCGRRFRSVIIADKKRVQPPPNLVENYFNVRSLEALRRNLNLPRDENTVHRWLINDLNKISTWEDYLSDSSIKSNLSYVMGLDLTNLKIRKRYVYYLHVVDFTNNHLVYEILESKDAANIETILIKVRSSGYVPVVIVTDLAKELLQAIRKVFPNAVIQGCLFHLMMWLNKRLPTKNIRPTDAEKAAVWNKVKYTIMKVASAKSREERMKFIEQLKNLTVKLDIQAKTVVHCFLRNIQYYHTLDELMLLGCKPEWRYNNACERAMRSVKDLSCKMYGFKTIEHARKYINAMWAIKRKDENKEHDTQRQRLVQETLLPFFVSDHTINLAQVADIMNVDINRLKEQVEQQGFIVTGRIAFKKSYLETIREKILRERPKTISDMLRIREVDPSTACELLEALGIRLLWKNLKEVLLIYPEVTDEKEHLRTESENNFGHG